MCSAENQVLAAMSLEIFTALSTSKCYSGYRIFRPLCIVCHFRKHPSANYNILVVRVLITFKCYYRYGVEARSFVQNLSETYMKTEVSGK